MTVNPIILIAALVGVFVSLKVLGGISLPRLGVRERVTDGLGSIFSTGLDSIYKKYGALFGIDHKLLKSIAIVESSENPRAIGNDINGRSMGLMQLFCQTDPSGLRVCKNVLPSISSWPPNSIDDLFDPDYSVKVGAGILKWNQDNFGFNRGIAMYNNYGARNDPENGPYRNQSYVDKVLGLFNSM